MLTKDYAPFEKRMDAVGARIEKIPKFLEEFRSRFANQSRLSLGSNSLGNRSKRERSVSVHPVRDKGKVSDKVYERLDKAIGKLQPALKVHLEWLNSLLAESSEEWALGREKFEKLLRLRELGLTSDEILQLGEKYLKVPSGPAAPAADETSGS